MTSIEAIKLAIQLAKEEGNKALQGVLCSVSGAALSNSELELLRYLQPFTEIQLQKLQSLKPSTN